MSDIFREVDEEVRRERLKQLWERHSNLIVAVALLIVLGVAGWRGYDWWEPESRRIRRPVRGGGQAGRRRQAGRSPGGVLQDRAGRKLRLSHPRALPGGRRTCQDRRGRGGEGLCVACGGFEPRPHAARSCGRPRGHDPGRYRAACRSSTGKLEPLTTADRPFRHTARELLALSAWRNGDAAAAKRWLDLIATDAETPAGTRAAHGGADDLVERQGEDLRERPCARC